MSANAGDAEEEYDCGICGRTFRSRRALEAHVEDAGLLY